MTVSEVTFILGSGPQAREVSRGLAERFRTRRERPSSLRRDYYDTFDWRLYRDGGTLSAEHSTGERLLRWRGRDGATLHRARLARVPDFARELEAGSFRAALSRVAGIRRLLPVVNVELTGDSIAVLDRREKTVVRLFHERGSAAPDPSGKRRPLTERLRVVPVRGYEADHRAVVQYLEQTSIDRHDGSELDLALAAVGSRPASYTSKLDIALDPEMRADEAARRILTRLLETMRANEDGCSRDLDPEFLHDFRVAVRRTRSCLGQVKGVFDRPTIGRFRGEFAWLGRATGKARDLDVWLLKLEGYRSEIPATLQAGLDGLETWLRGRQRAEQRKVARILGGRRYRELTRDWNRFLRGSASAPPEAAPNAGRPVLQIATERIGKAHDRVLERSAGLDGETPAEAIHRLRIDCKKLRYLLEFFGSVFEERRVAAFVKSLKRLQDQLGDFNDFAVQRADLREAAAIMVGQGPSDADTLLAMGCLIGRLAARQDRLKRRLIDSVRRFAGESAQQGLRELLS